MLAFDFIQTKNTDLEILQFDKHNLDITKIKEIEKRVDETKPDLILNLAAYTDIERAEGQNKKINYDVNALGNFNLAKVAADKKIDFITVSTDYVFDGTKKKGYAENDTPNPINQYGMAKYLGEKLSLNSNPNSIVIRTGWIYG